MNRTLALAAAAVVLAACSHDNNNTPPPLPAGCSLPDPQVSGLSVEQVIELGVHAVGDRVTFTVPPGTGSISIVEQAKGDVPLLVVFQENDAGQVLDNSAVPRFVYFPDGGVAYDDFKAPPVGADKTTDPSGTYIEYSLDTPVASSFTFPNTSNSLASGVAPGAWSFVVSDFAFECATASNCLDGGTSLDKYDVKVLLRPLAGGTTLDVNFYIVGAVANPGTGAQLTAANAAADTRVKRMVSTFTSFYAAAGVTVGQVNFFEVTAEQRASFAHLTVSDEGGGQGPCDSLAQMFLISAAHPGVAMNLFLVNDITDVSPNGGNVVGIDGTIPGPSSIAGTVNSGAAVTLSDLYAGACTGTAPNLGFCGADRVAYIAAHETGHFLGLFHTSEMGGDLVDPLNDTGKCVCTACAATVDKPNCGMNGSTAPQLHATQCNGAPSSNCSGADNLMFWLLDQSISQGHLTAEQGRVMRLNPLVR